MARYGNVDERIVEMQFENRQFEKGAKESISTLDKLKSALNLTGAAKGFDEIDNASKKLNFGSLQQSVDAIGEKFSAMGILGITAMQRISNSFLDVTEKALRFATGIDQITSGFSKFEQKTSSIGTLLGQGFDLDEVNSQMERLTWFTDETSYDLTNMIASIGKFTATGKGLTESVDAMEGIALWAALSGQNAQKANQAMYQLSQALGAGVMRKEDYKSIQNLSMDTDEFRQIALDTAIAMGTLKKNSDGTYQSLVANTKAFEKSQFAEHLTQDLWFTSDVMMEVFQRYASATQDIYEYTQENNVTASRAIEALGDSVDELGLRALKAGQEARTFSDVMSAVSDVVATGWMQSFEYIIGDYDEAVSFWTDMVNALIDVVYKFTDFRNGILEVWKDLGGRGKMLDAAYNMFSGFGNIGNMLSKSFAGAIGFGKSLDQLKDSEWATSYEARQLFDELDNLQEQLHRMKVNGDSAELLEGKQAEIDGVIESLRAIDRGHMLDGISQKILTFSDRFKEAIHFEDTISRNVKRINELKNILAELGTGLGTSARRKAIQDEIDSLITANQEYRTFGTVLEYVKNIWEGFMSVVRVGKDIFEGLKQGLEPILSVLSRLLRPIGNVASAIGELVTAFNDVLVESGIIKSSLSDFGSSIADFIAPAVDWLADAFDTLAEYIRNAAVDIRDGISPIGGWIDTLKTKIENFLKTFSVKLPSLDSAEGFLAKFVKMWQDFWEGTEPIADKIGSVIGNLWEIVKTVFGKLVDILADVLKQLGLTIGDGGNIIQNLYQLASAIMQIWLMFSAKNTLDANPFEALSEALYGFANNMNAKAFKEGAKGILILAGALFVIASIDSNKLLGATLVLEVILGSVAKIMETILKLTDRSSDTKAVSQGGLFGIVKRMLIGGEGNSTGTSLSFIGDALKQSANIKALGDLVLKIGVAIGLMAGSMWVIGQLNLGQVVIALVSVGAILQMMGAYAKKMQEVEGFKSDGIIKMAAGLYIMALSIKKLGDLELGQALQGVGVIGAILLELAGFNILLKKFGNSDLDFASLGTGMILMAVAMNIFARSIKSFAEMNLSQLAKGFGSMLAVLVLLGLELGMLEDVPVLQIAAGFLVLSFAMANIAAIIALLGKANWKTLAKGVGAMVTAIGGIALAIGLLSKFGGNQLLQAAAAIVVVAAAMNLLIAPMMLLGNMDFWDIVKALIALAGALAIIGFAGAIFGQFSKEILMFGASVALIGVGLMAIGAGLTLIGTGLTVLVTGIMTSLSALVLGIGTFFAAFVVAIAEAAGSIALAIGILGAAIIEGLTMLIMPIAELIGTLGDAIVTVLKEHVNFIGNSIFDILTELLGVIASRAPELVQAIFDFVVNIFNGLAVTIMNSGGELLDAIGRVVESIAYFVLEAMQRLIDSGLLSGNPLFSIFGDKLSEGIDAMKDGLRSDIESGSNKVDASEMIEVDTETIAGKGQEAGDSFVGAFKGVFSSGGMSFGEEENPLTAEGGLLSSLSASLTEAAPGLGTDFATNIFSDTEGITETLTTGSTDMGDTLVNTLTDRLPDLNQFGVDVPSEIIKGEKTKQKDLKTESETAGNNIEDPIKTVEGTMYGHGQNVMDGLIGGIRSKMEELRSVMAEVASITSAGYAGPMKIESPSKVFRQFGVFTIQGLVNGIHENAELPGVEVSNIAQSMVDAMDEKMAGESMAPTITPVVDLTNARSAAGTIDSMITAQRAEALSASMELNAQVTQMDQLVDMTGQILGSIQNGSDLYLDDSILAGRINRRLGFL